MIQDEKITQALVTLLESNIGYGIDFFGGMLKLYQLEDTRFSVNHFCYNHLDQNTTMRKYLQTHLKPLIF